MGNQERILGFSILSQFFPLEASWKIFSAHRKLSLHGLPDKEPKNEGGKNHFVSPPSFFVF